jgi:type II secretory ATPase GspE/PulE/Tfp pilus assembly ATPase PilB-like protein
MLDLGAEPYLVNSTLLAVVAQRLVRLVCSHCREEYEPADEEIAELGLEPAQIPGGVLSRGAGCEACADTGYLGRTGIYEILVVDDAVKEQIGRRASAAEIKRSAVTRGLTTLRADALSKMFAGLTTPEEVVRVTQLDTI